MCGLCPHLQHFLEIICFFKKWEDWLGCPLTGKKFEVYILAFWTPMAFPCHGNGKEKRNSLLFNFFSPPHPPFSSASYPFRGWCWTCSISVWCRSLTHHTFQDWSWEVVLYATKIPRLVNSLPWSFRKMSTETICWHTLKFSTGENLFSTQASAGKKKKNLKSLIKILNANRIFFHLINIYWAPFMCQTLFWVLIQKWIKEATPCSCDGKKKTEDM